MSYSAINTAKSVLYALFDNPTVRNNQKSKIIKGNFNTKYNYPDISKSGMY